MRRVLILLLVAVGIGLAVLAGREKLRTPASDGEAAAPAKPVQTGLGMQQAVIDELPAYGNLLPRRVVNITAPQAGRVSAILFEDGAKVAAGVPLVSLESSVFQAQVASAEARAKTQQENLRRTRDLASQGLESTRSVEQAQSEAAAGVADLRTSQARLELTTLRAPFAGSLGVRLIDAGAIVSTGDKIVTIEDRSRLFVDIRVPSRYLSSLHAGMDVALRMPGTDANLGIGKLTLVENNVSSDTRSVLARAELDNSDGRLAPGLFVRASIVLGTRPDAVVVPAEAVQRELVGAYVFVVNDGIATRRAVVLGQDHGSNVEVSQGLKVGERIVTIGAFRLNSGDRIDDVPKVAEVTR
jgi:RND family efflux transporter MFP subunit